MCIFVSFKFMQTESNFDFHRNEMLRSSLEPHENIGRWHRCYLLALNPLRNPSANQQKSPIDWMIASGVRLTVCVDARSITRLTALLRVKKAITFEQCFRCSSSICGWFIRCAQLALEWVQRFFPPFIQIELPLAMRRKKCFFLDDKHSNSFRKSIYIWGSSKNWKFLEIVRLLWQQLVKSYQLSCTQRLLITQKM